MRAIVLGLVLVVACGTGKPTPATDAGDGDGDAPGDGGGEALCGGFAGMVCDDDEYCDYPNNDCGIADQTGTCRPRPVACPLVIGPPICGCDGQIHTGECVTYATGTDLSAGGGCPVDPSRFACGYTQCELATEYCRRRRESSGIDSYACVPLPAACSRDVSCGCLVGQPCGTMCRGEAKTGLFVTCQ